MKNIQAILTFILAFLVIGFALWITNADCESVPPEYFLECNK